MQTSQAPAPKHFWLLFIQHCVYPEWITICPHTRHMVCSWKQWWMGHQVLSRKLFNNLWHYNVVLMSGVMYGQAELCKWGLMWYAYLMCFDTDWLRTDCMCLALTGLKSFWYVFTVWCSGNWQLISCWRAGRCTHICNFSQNYYFILNRHNICCSLGSWV